ncbi:MAG: hypothetical protein ABFS45_16500 [Pseudomonadota bacterium]
MAQAGLSPDRAHCLLLAINDYTGIWKSTFEVFVSGLSLLEIVKFFANSSPTLSGKFSYKIFVHINIGSNHSFQ